MWFSGQGYFEIFWCHIMGLLRRGCISVETLTCGPLHLYSLIQGRNLSTGGSFRNSTINALNSPSENLSNVKKGFAWLKAIFKKIAASSIVVSWEFLVISEDSYTTKRLLMSYFLCTKDHSAYYSCLNYNTKDICGAGSCFLKTVKFQKTFNKIGADDIQEFWHGMKMRKFRFK